MMRQDRFTEQAQDVLQNSQEIVRDAAALPVGRRACAARARAAQGRARARRAVDAWASSRRRVARAIAQALNGAPKLGYDVVQMYTTPRIVRMLETANAEAERLQGRVRRRRAPPDRDRRRARGRVGGDHARVQHQQGAHLPRAAGGARHRARRLARLPRSAYQALAKYSRDLTKLARAGQARPRRSGVTSRSSA